MPDPDQRSPWERDPPLPSHGDELFGVSGDPGQTGPIRPIPAEPTHETSYLPESAPTVETGPPTHGTEPTRQMAPGNETAPLRVGHWVTPHGRDRPGPPPGASPQPPGAPPGSWMPPRGPVPPGRPGGRRISGRAVALAFAVLVVLAVPVVAILVSRDGADVTPGRATPSTPGAPAAPVVRTDTGAELVQGAARTDTDCAAHSYGRVHTFLTSTPCTSLRRALYTANSSHGAVVVSVSRVQMASVADATRLQNLTDASGTGNVSDLLREGVRVGSGPTRLRDASYASRRQGSVVVIVEASSTSGGEHDLDSLTQAALVLGN